MIHLRGNKAMTTPGYGAGANPFPQSNPLPYSLKTGGSGGGSGGSGGGGGGTSMGDSGSDSGKRGSDSNLAMESGKRKRPGGKKRSVAPPSPNFSDSMGAGSRAGESSRAFSSVPKRGFPQKRY